MSLTSDRIFRLLQESGINQKEIAKALQIAPQTVTDWKTGKSHSYTKYLPQIAEALNVSIENLVEGGNKMKLAYRLPEADEQVKELADKIIQVILASGCTYQKADDALSEAQKRLLEQTRPVIVTELRSCD